MKFYQLKAKTRNFLNVVLSDPLRKNLINIFFEYSWFIFSNKTVADQYFKKYLYRKGNNNFYDFLITEKLETSCWRLNNPVYISILDDKKLFEDFFSSYGLRVIKSFAFNRNSLLFLDNRFIELHSPEEFIKNLKPFMQKSDTNSIFIKRKEASCGGKGIYKLSLSELINNSKKIIHVYNEVINSSYIFQNELIQHTHLLNLNPGCLNTLRIDTYTNNNNNSKVMSSFLRMGVNESFVDNVSSGGIFVGVNINNGRLFKNAYSDFTHGRAKTFSYHPLTEKIFNDFQIPFFPEALDLAIKAAQLIPGLKLIGWDIAITETGPILIEGNDTPAIAHSEVSQGGFRNNKVFVEMITDKNLK